MRSVHPARNARTVRLSRNGRSGGTMKLAPSAYGYAVLMVHGMTSRSAAQSCAKPSFSANAAYSRRVVRVADRPETGRKRPNSISPSARGCAELVPLQLAGLGTRELVEELDGAGVFVRGDLALHEVLELTNHIESCLGRLAQHHERLHDVAALRIGRADDAALLDPGMIEQDVFD